MRCWELSPRWIRLWCHNEGMKEWIDKYPKHTYIIAIPHLWIFFFYSSRLQNNYTSISIHDVLHQHSAQIPQWWPRPFTFSWEAAAFPSSLFSSISSSLHSQSPSSVLWRWPLDPGTRRTWIKRSHIFTGWMCTALNGAATWVVQRMHETRKTNLCGYQSTDNWKEGNAPKDHTACRLPRSFTLETH